MKDGFEGCVLVSQSSVKSARRAFEELPKEIKQNATLPLWLAADVRAYWETTVPQDDTDKRQYQGRDVQAVLAAIARLRKSIERLPNRCLGDETSDAFLERNPWAVAAYMSGPSRIDEFMKTLARFESEIRQRLSRRRRGPRLDWKRQMLEDLVGRSLHSAGIKLTKSRGGILARTLIAVYSAAGITAPQYDSLLPILRRITKE